jgi:hypothetical protein
VLPGLPISGNKPKNIIFLSFSNPLDPMVTVSGMYAGESVGLKPINNFQNDESYYSFTG